MNKKPEKPAGGEPEKDESAKAAPEPKRLRPPGKRFVVDRQLRPDRKRGGYDTK